MTTFEALQDRADASFVSAALASDLVDVTFSSVASPFGELFVAATDIGVVRVAFAEEDQQQVLEQLAADLSPRILESAAQLDEVRRSLDAYFDGSAHSIDVPVDLRLVRGAFRREVVERIREIPFGATQTYSELAVDLGRPRAVRAVGSGCATNPVPIIVPCHRVLRTGGGMGGYLGGLERKAWLLDLEQAS